MPVGGFVLTLSSDHASRRPLIVELARTPGVTLGDAHGLRLPLVLEAESALAMDEACRRLGQLRGVAWVELAYLDLTDLAADREPPEPESWSKPGEDDGQT